MCWIKETCGRIMLSIQVFFKPTMFISFPPWWCHLKFPKVNMKKQTREACKLAKNITMSFQTLKHSQLLLYLFWTINNSLLERKKNTNKIQFNYLKTKHLVLGKLDLKGKNLKIFWLKPSEEFCWKAKRSHFFLTWPFLNCVSAVPLKWRPQNNMLCVKHSSELSALPC